MRLPATPKRRKTLPAGNSPGPARPSTVLALCSAFLCLRHTSKTELKGLSP